MSDEDEIMEEGFGVDSGNKLKGIGESAGANHDDIKQVYPKIRDRIPDDEYKISLSVEFIFNVPHIARFLDFAVDLEVFPPSLALPLPSLPIYIFYYFYIIYFGEK